MNKSKISWWLLTIFLVYLSFTRSLGIPFQIGFWNVEYTQKYWFFGVLVSQLIMLFGIIRNSGFILLASSLPLVLTVMIKLQIYIVYPFLGKISLDLLFSLSCQILILSLYSLILAGTFSARLMFQGIVIIFLVSFVVSVQFNSLFEILDSYDKYENL